MAPEARNAGGVGAKQQHRAKAGARVGSLSKLKSVLVTLLRTCGCAAQLIQRRAEACTARGDDHAPCSRCVRAVRAGAPLATSEMPCRKGRRSAASESQNRAVCAGTKVPAHILPGTRGCSPSGAVLVRTYTFLAQVLVRLAGSRPAGRVSLGMEYGERTGRSPFARGSARQQPLTSQTQPTSG